MSRSSADGVHPQLRRAVLDCLADLRSGDQVLVACSGGPDSLALAAATVQVSRERNLRCAAVIVDHQLQPGSAEVAEQAAVTCRLLGMERIDVIPVSVTGDGGPEAAARAARYQALAACAEEVDAVAVLLAHTMDDQAETVLLRLARGSGARTLAAMAPQQGLYRRPFLGLARAIVHEGCQQALAPLGRQPWQDPHNVDSRFARVRVRTVLADLVQALGPGVVAGLARSAALLRDDADALDEQAQTWLSLHVQESANCPRVEYDLPVEELMAMTRAVRTRVIRACCLAAGSPAADLDRAHIDEVERLVTHWHGQGEVALPGQVQAWRDYGRLRIHGRQ
ncbi:MAG: tRNA lysidine(34) synthetase TilS [Actinomycetales bacterium]